MPTWAINDKHVVDNQSFKIVFLQSDPYCSIFTPINYPVLSTYLLKASLFHKNVFKQLMLISLSEESILLLFLGTIKYQSFLVIVFTLELLNKFI